MLYADILLRGGTVALAFLVATALLLRGETRRLGWPVLATGVTLAGFLTNTSLAFESTGLAEHPVPLLAMSLLPLAQCWLVIELFLDGPDNRRPWYAMSGFAAVASLLCFGWPQLALVRAGVIMVFFLVLLVVALITAHDDLVERRRRFRPLFLISMAGFGALSAGVELASATFEMPAMITVLKAGGTFVLVLFFALWILRPERDLTEGQALPQTAPAAPRRAAPRDAGLVAALNTALAEGIWRREGLTIADLGAELGIAEHRLRALINQQLGFRNFPTFINSYRIKAAKDVLSDPAEARRTILEIAYDVGFASLGPFNKAFRAETGESPSEFRKRALDSAPAPAVFENLAPVSKSGRARVN